MDLYLMSPPRADWALRGRANPRSKNASAVDATRARHEWLALAEGIESLGGRVAVLGPVDDVELTGMPFAAEAGCPLPAATAGGKPRFVLPRMKSEHRKGERAHWAPFVERLGFETVELSDGIFEGQGDVALFDHTMLVFWGGRTDLVGAHAFKALVSGVEILEVQVREPAFHGNMAVLPLERTSSLLVCADVVEDDSLAVLEARFGRDQMHFVSEEEIQAYSTNALPVGSTVLAPSILPNRVRKLIERGGYAVAELAMTELCEKAGGASRCLVCVASVTDDFVIPDDVSLASVARSLR